MIIAALVVVGVIMACRSLSNGSAPFATPRDPVPIIDSPPQESLIPIRDFAHPILFDSPPQEFIDPGSPPNPGELSDVQIIRSPFGDPWVPTPPADERVVDGIWAGELGPPQLYAAPWPTGYFVRADGRIVWVTSGAIHLVYDYGTPSETMSAPWVRGLTLDGDRFAFADGPAYSGTYSDSQIAFSWGETFRLLSAAIGNPAMPVKTPQYVLAIPTDPELPTLPANSGGVPQDSSAMPPIQTISTPQPGDFAYPTPTPTTDPNLFVYFASDPPPGPNEETPCVMENWAAETDQPADDPQGDTYVDPSDGWNNETAVP